MQKVLNPRREAALDMLLLFVPVLPFALVFGVVVVESGVPALLGWMTSPIVFGGAAQLTLVSLIGEGASISAAVTAALIVTSRHLLYSVSMAPRFQTQPAWFRWLGPYMLIDQVFALTQIREFESECAFRSYYLTSGFLFWSSWWITTGLGILLAPYIPMEFGVEFAVPLLFLGLLILGIKRSSQVLTAVVSAGVAIVFAGLDNKLGLMVAVFAGLLVAVIMEWREPS